MNNFHTSHFCEVVATAGNVPLIHQVPIDFSVKVHIFAYVACSPDAGNWNTFPVVVAKAKHKRIPILDLLYCREGCLSLP